MLMNMHCVPMALPACLMAVCTHSHVCLRRFVHMALFVLMAVCTYGSVCAYGSSCFRLFVLLAVRAYGPVCLPYGPIQLWPFVLAL